MNSIKKIKISNVEYDVTTALTESLTSISNKVGNAEVKAKDAVYYTSYTEYNTAKNEALTYTYFNELSDEEKIKTPAVAHAAATGLYKLIDDSVSTINQYIDTTNTKQDEYIKHLEDVIVRFASLHQPTITTTVPEGAIVFNEFSTAEKWAELYNTTDSEISLLGLIIKGEDRSSSTVVNRDDFTFTLASCATSIPAKGYAVVYWDNSNRPFYGPNYGMSGKKRWYFQLCNNDATQTKIAEATNEFSTEKIFNAVTGEYSYNLEVTKDETLTAETATTYNTANNLSGDKVVKAGDVVKVHDYWVVNTDTNGLNLTRESDGSETWVLNTASKGKANIAPTFNTSPLTVDFTEIVKLNNKNKPVDTEYKSNNGDINFEGNTDTITLKDETVKGVIVLKEKGGSVLKVSSMNNNIISKITITGVGKKNATVLVSKLNVTGMTTTTTGELPTVGKTSDNGTVQTFEDMKEVVFTPTEAKENVTYTIKNTDTENKCSIAKIVVEFSKKA